MKRQVFFALAALCAAGAVSENRPNTFFEGFEGRGSTPDYIYKSYNNYLPDGWSDISKADPANKPYPDDPTDFTWVTMPSNALNAVTPWGACFAMVQCHYGATPEASDEWLVTPTITPQTDDLLHFYMAYNPYFMLRDRENGEGWLSRLEVLASTDDGANWTLIWNNYDEALKVSAEERYKASIGQSEVTDFNPYYIEIKDYYNKPVKFAFRFVGAGGYRVAIDNVTVGVPYPEAKYTLPEGILYPALLPGVLEPKSPMFMGAPDTEYVWKNDSFNGRASEWAYTGLDGEIKQTTESDLTTPAYPTGTVAALPQLITSFGPNTDGPWVIATNSNLDPDNPASGNAAIRFGGEAGEVEAVDGSLVTGGFATYNYFDPNLKALAYNRLIEFSGDVDRAWEALLGMQEHEDDFVMGIGSLIPQMSKPYGLKYVYINAIVMEAGENSKLKLSICKWETEEIAGVQYNYVGDELATATTSIHADQENYQGIMFDLSDMPVTIDSPVIALITGFDRKNDWIRFLYLSSENTDYPGTSLMTFKEVSSDGQMYDAYQMLHEVPLGQGNRRCSGVLMGFGACYFNVELIGTDNTIELPKEGGEKTFVVKTDAKPEDFRLLFNGKPCEFASCDAVAGDNEGEVKVTVKASLNTEPRPYDTTVSIAVPGASTDIKFKQEAGEAGIGTITGDAAEAVYYNLQGVRVDKPEKGNVYVVRRGTSVSKVLVK